MRVRAQLQTASVQSYRSTGRVADRRRGPVGYTSQVRSWLLLPVLVACNSSGGDALDAASPDAQRQGYYTPTSPPPFLSTNRIELWLDASQTSSVISADGAVTRWRDLSPHQRDATQAVPSARPIVAASGPALMFDGIDDQLLTPAFLEEASYSMFVATANLDAALPIAGRHISTAMSTEGCAPGASGFTLFTYSSELLPNDVRFPGFATETQMSFYVRVNKGYLGGSKMAGMSFAPGTSIAKDEFAAMSLQFFPNGIGGPELSLGAFHGGCQFGNVAIAEVIVVNSGIDTGNLFAIEDYLAAKWGARL